MPLSTPSSGRTEVDTGEMRTATVDLTVAGRKVHFQLDVPIGPTRPFELLPIFRTLTDTFVRIAVENVEADGETISCRKGCGACCRQLVPISEIEAESIRRLVDELPPPRQRETVARFENAARQLEASGLLATLRASEHVTREDIRSLGTAYFEQGIPCPFLEDESCSIHAERPLACREYLVTSPAANCAKPSAESVRCVTIPAKISRAIRHLDTGEPNHSATWIPMILVLERPRNRQDITDAPPGTASIARLFEQLSGKAIPEQ